MTQYAQVAPPPPAQPPYELLPLGFRIPVGLGAATVLPDMDFETYSEAGYYWNEARQAWDGPPGASANKKGLPVIGAAKYAEHPSTDVLCFAYDLKDGKGRRQWLPGMPPPVDLFEYLACGGLVEAWNKGFEQWIWEKVCTPRYGWPALPPHQVRCAMAKARAFNLPGSLDGAAGVLRLTQRKDKRGDALIKLFSMPQKPTRKQPKKRITFADEPVQADEMCAYNRQDIVVEAHASANIPDLEGEELENWLLDQRINARGVGVDVAAIENCIAIIEQAHARYNRELQHITGGAVQAASETQKMQGWLAAYGVRLDAMDEEAVDAALARTDLEWHTRRVLEIRQLIGSAAVKKAFAMRNQATAAGSLHDLFIYYGARTGRTTGSGPQPTNLPNSGPQVFECFEMLSPAPRDAFRKAGWTDAAMVEHGHAKGCRQYYGADLPACPWCGAARAEKAKPQEWNADAVESALRAISTRDLDAVERHFGDAMAAVSGCLRGLFVARPGHDLICSDYSAIEAVVLAMIAGEQWRIDLFRTHGKIYEMSAAKISGVDFDEFMRHAGYTDAELAAPDWYMRKPAAPTGKHHPLRKTIGKVAELACFGPNTMVLTDSGYVPICRLSQDDRVWDGVEFVDHGGRINKGARLAICLDGVRVTASHPVYMGDEWETALALQYNGEKFEQALAVGGKNLPWNAREGGMPYSDVYYEGDVYDILDAGPRNRFTIATDSGHLIVHNSGYQGWKGAWIAFGADQFMTEKEMVKAILAWRKASPNIVEFWGGQEREVGPWSYVPELYGVEGMFVAACMSPGQVFEFRGFKFRVVGEALYLTLLNGRHLTYHRPVLRPETSRNGNIVYRLSYEGNNTNPKNGPVGWIRMDTWGGRLTENIVQATARDLQWYGMRNLEAAGYPIVLHVYDEDIAEVPEGFGSVAEFERIMSTMPPWAHDWPVKASGGWRGKRYRKD